MRGSSILLIVALTGCAAHSGLVRDGNQAVRYGSWDAAVSSYEQANLLSPHNPRIQAKLDSARTSQEIDRARRLSAAASDLATAVARQDWAAAHDAMSRARDADAGVADEMGWEAYQALVPAAMRHLSAGELEPAFGLAHVAVVVHAEAGAYRLLADVTTALHARVDKLADSGDWASALSWVDWMETRDIAFDASARRRDLKRDWARFIAGQAKTAESVGNLGSAAVGYHQAFGVDGDRAWLAERDRAVRSVEASLGYDVRWPGEGTSLDSAVQRVTRASLATDGRLTLSTSGSTIASVDLDVTEHGCANTSVTTTDSVRVLVGTRQVTNPEYEPALRSLRIAEGKRSELMRAGLTADDALELAAASVHSLMEYKLPAVRGAADRAEQDVAWARRRVIEAEDALASASALYEDPLGVDPELDRLRRNLVTAERRLGESEQARRSVARARADLDEGVRLVSQRTERADRTPRTVTEDVYEPFAYPVEQWTRTCSWTAAVRHREGSQDMRRSWTETQVTIDERHDAYPHAGVDSDPLHFPGTDDRMQAAAETKLGTTLAAHLTDSAHDYYTSLWNGALVLSPDNPAAALDAWLAVLRLDPTVADGTGLAALRSRAGVSDTSWMRSR
jgi:tetratricopeptide (TPR) repeat protein